jgi:hypothetical protein
MEPGSTEHLGDFLLSQGRAENSQPLHEIANGLGKLVDWLTGLDQGLVSCLIDLTHPGADGLRGQQEDVGSLRQGPSSRGVEFQDRHAFRGWVVRSPLGIELCHPDILDADLLPEQGHFLFEAVTVGFQPDALVRAVGGQLREWIRAYWARAIMWRTADLTCLPQALGSGISGALLLLAILDVPGIVFFGSSEG